MNPIIAGPRTRIAAAAAALTLTALSLAACSSSGSSDAAANDCTIAFSHPASTAPVVKAVVNYAQKRADEVGCKLLVDNPNGDQQVQVNDVDNWIAQGVDAIVILPIDPASLAGAQSRAEAAGIKWLSYVAADPNADGAVVFPPDESGKKLADAAVAWIKEQPTPPDVLVLTASSLPIISGRWTTMIDAIKTQTNAKLVATQDAQDPAMGLSVTENVLAANPNLRVVLGMNDDGALGALKAFENAGVPVAESFIGGQDGTEEALDAVKTGGAYRATVSVDIAGVGKAVVDAARNAITGSGDSVITITPILAAQGDTATIEELLGQFR